MIKIIIILHKTSHLLLNYLAVYYIIKNTGKLNLFKSEECNTVWTQSCNNKTWRFIKMSTCKAQTSNPPIPFFQHNIYINNNYIYNCKGKKTCRYGTELILSWLLTQWNQDGFDDEQPRPNHTKAVLRWVKTLSDVQYIHINVQTNIHRFKRWTNYMKT